jgi:signal transduction histidine kinase
VVDPGGPPAAGGSDRRLAAIAALSALAVFAVDLWLPLGVALPSLYLPVVLLGLWSRGRRFGVVTAVACGALTVLAPLVSRGGRPPSWIEALNRPLMLVPLLLGALLVARFKRAAQRLAEREAETARVRREAEADRMRAEAARWRAESLARVGEMAAVVAHEVRNPLAGIKGVLQIVGQRLPPDAGERHALQDATSRLDALAALTEELLLFARPAPPQRTPVSLLALARTTRELLQADRALADLTIEVSGDPGELLGDPLQLRRAILNLVRNAAEATDGKGRVVVRVRDRGDAVELSVSDAGPGVPEELRERVFEPFFTTRARGSGLGLAIVHRTVEGHGGEIAAEAAAQGGACFRITLPRRAGSSP